jgi:peptidoglycan/LPS O-acetylase OafA/YrhL
MIERSNHKTVHSAPIGYRSDIDGLRAFCIIAVIGFHVGLPGFAGGYVGVDVFFVVSGYLITLLLVAPSRLTFWQRLRDFYVRRARRILPALLVVLAVSTFLALVLFTPPDLRNYGRSVVFASALLGNVGAWLNGGYYTPTGRFTPLQHLWSIGAEEQFYLFYPLLLLAIGVFWAKQRSRLLAVLALCSFVVCVWASYRSPIANFYFLPTRAWQLLVGALVATICCRHALSRSMRELWALLGLGVLAFTVASYDATIPYPGIHAIAPTLAAAALLASGATHSTIVGKVLSAPPLVFTGLISYSLYLWHAPLLAFAEYYNIESLGTAGKSVLLILLYAIAAFTWAVIERPVRTRDVLPSTKGFATATGGVAVLLSAIGIVLWQSAGLPERFAPELRALTDAVDRFDIPASDCMGVSLEQVREGNLCSFGPQESLKHVVIWGDSHAFALLPAYRWLADKHGARMHFASVGACRPLLGVKSARPFDTRHEYCVAFNEAMVRAVQRIDPHLVIFNAYWGNPDQDLIVADSEASTDGRSPFLVAFERVLSRTNVPHRSACIVLTVPGYDYPLPYALAIAQRRGLADDAVAMSRRDALIQYASVESDARSLEARHLVNVVDPKDVLCPRDTCELRTAAGEPVYRDANHLSIEGALLTGSVLEGCLADRDAVLARRKR